MSDANILMNMAVEKNRLIEEQIALFLGYLPHWKERRAFNFMHKLGESEIYHKGKHVATVRYSTPEEAIG